MNFSNIAMSNETRMLRPQNHEIEEKNFDSKKKLFIGLLKENNNIDMF
jgi:hypothetical protein